MAENDVIDLNNETEEEEEEYITCPVCGEDVDPGTENCPLCGAPVGALENNNISGTSIDNSAAIDAMLQSAAMLVEESASLGVALDDDEDDDADEEGITAGMDYDEDPDPVRPGRSVDVPPDPEPLPEPAPTHFAEPASVPFSVPAKEQDSQTEAAAPSAPPVGKKARASKRKGKRGKSEAPTLYAVDDNGNPIPEENEQKGAASDSKKKKPAKKPKENKAKTKDKVKDKVRDTNRDRDKNRSKDNNRNKNADRDRNRAASPVLVIVTAVVALALGCAVGFFGKTMFFPDIVLPECQDFAERAVLGVNSVVDGNMYVAEAYVRESGDSTQCVFRALTSGTGDTAQVRWFRVKVYSDAPDTVRIYFQLDMDKYNAMMNSGDNEQRIQASLLMSNQQEMDRCISEIQSGAGGWSAANAALLNDSLHPIPDDSNSAYGS